MSTAFSNAVAYDRFMGRYSRLLSPRMADLGRVGAGQRVLDVGCGPGALVEELVARVGAGNVAAVDPSDRFVESVRERYPGVDARIAVAESLPFGDGSFDAALAQLVVHFMGDPVAGLREMARVTRRGGSVVACVWDARRASPLTPFWHAARALDPTVLGEDKRPGVREGHLVELFREAGLADVVGSEITCEVRHATFEEWWDPFELNVGPPGEHLRRMSPDERVALREKAREILPSAPFTLKVRAWAASGRVPEHS